MKIYRKISALTIVLASFATFSANAQVSCSATQCTGPAEELISSIFPLAAGGIVLNSPATVSATGCTGAAGGANNVLLPETHANYKEIYAAMLTASVAAKDVQIRIDETLAECTVKFARMFN